MSNYYDTGEAREKKGDFKPESKENEEMSEESRQLTCPIYFAPTLIEKDIKEVMYPEKSVTCPIFFLEESGENNIETCSFKGKETEEIWNEIIKSESEMGQSMPPVSPDDSQRKNTDEGYDPVEQSEESHVSFIEASINKDIEDEQKVNETLLPASENGYQENICADQKDKKTMRRLRYIAAKVHETGEVSQMQHESEEDAGSVVLTRGAVERILGCSAYELICEGIEGKQFDGLPKKIKKSKPKAISNFEVTPVKVIHYLNRAGQENGDGKIVCHITIYNRLGKLEKTFEIDLKETGNLTGYILKKYPMAIIYEPKRKNERTIENNFRSRISEAEAKVCYVNAGWNQVNGKPMYIYKDIRCPDVITNTQLNLPVDTQITRYEIPDYFGRILTLYEDERMLYALMLYSYLGIFYKVFDDAGRPPHFLMFMHGVSGSMKTSIAKVLYVQLCDEEHRKYPRRLDTDSETSMERGLILTGVDTVTLFDDYAPPKTIQKGNDVKNKLEALIRMAGDGSTRSRSNTNLEDRRGEGLKGMLVITGELKGTGLSSNLRCLYCEVKKEYVNTGTLSWLQGKR